MLYAWMEFVAFVDVLVFVTDLLHGSCDGTRERERKRERERENRGGTRREHKRERKGGHHRVW